MQHCRSATCLGVRSQPRSPNNRGSNCSPGVDMRSTSGPWFPAMTAVKVAVLLALVVCMASSGLSAMAAIPEREKSADDHRGSYRLDANMEPQHIINCGTWAKPAFKDSGKIVGHGYHWCSDAPEDCTYWTRLMWWNPIDRVWMRIASQRGTRCPPLVGGEHQYPFQRCERPLRWMKFRTHAYSRALHDSHWGSTYQTSETRSRRC